MPANEIQFFSKSAPISPPRDYFDQTDKHWRRKLSNFHPVRIQVNGKLYDSVEHYFHAAKFFRTTPRLAERFAVGSKGYVGKEPLQAKKAGGRTGSQKLDSQARLDHEWDSGRPPLKERVMYDALLAKFSQHEDLKNLLLSTGNARLVHFGMRGEKYWGESKGNGRNRMGELLMRVRAELRAQLRAQQQRPAQ
jgi:ribA/ribD-fused uncharacterized protein